MHAGGFIGNSCLVGIKFLCFFFEGGVGVKQSVTTLCVERDTPEKPACNPIFIALFLIRKETHIAHISFKRMI